jgi:membrane protease subunit HflC
VLREELARSELTDIVRSTNREEFPDPVERGRKAIMEAVTAKCDKESREYGIMVVDVRIKRADLPKQNQQAIFGRMIAERDRISKQYRSEGEEEARKIRATTDYDVRVLKAEAYKEAEQFRGEGDGKAAAIYAEAYGQYEDFYEFTKSLETLEKTTTPGTRLLITTKSGLYSRLKEE